MAVQNGRKLLFINKTADSKHLTRSRGRERSEINSYVQRNGSTSQQMPKSVVSPTCSSSTRVVNKPPPHLCQASISSHVLFLKTKLEASQCDHSRYYMKIVQQVLYDPQKEPIILQGSVQISWMDQILAVAANDSMITNAILCAAAGSIYAMTLEKEHAMMSTFFKVQAIQELRVRVANPKSDDHALASNAAYTISLLIWIECLAGNLLDIQSHMLGLQSLMKYCHMDVLPPPMVGNIVSCMHLCSALLHTPPVAVPAGLARPSAGMVSAFAEDTPSFAAHSFHDDLREALGDRLLSLVAQRRNILKLQGQSKPTGMGLMQQESADVSIKQLWWENDILTFRFGEKNFSLAGIGVRRYLCNKPADCPNSEVPKSIQQGSPA